MSILVKVFGGMCEQWSLLLSIVIVVTITIANIFAILQTDLKRFMAYSSISQAGYIMLAALAGDGQGMSSLVYYIVVYIVANLAIFGVISAVEQAYQRMCRTFGIRRFVSHESTPDAGNDTCIVLIGRYPAVCRILL